MRGKGSADAECIERNYRGSLRSQMPIEEEEGRRHVCYRAQQSTQSEGVWKRLSGREACDAIVCRKHRPGNRAEWQ